MSKIDAGPIRKTGSPLLCVPNDIRVYGMDISRYQPKVDWKAAVDAGIKFCIAKASDGTGSKDVMFETHRKNAHANGIIFGAYHFLRFGGFNAKEETELFLKNSGGVHVGELPLTLDVEWDKQNPKYTSGKTMDDAAAAEALEVLERIEAATGMTPIIYCSYPFFKNFKNPERFARFLPWHPAYGGVKGPKVPLPWSKFLIWQYTDKHPSARNIVSSEGLDGDIFNGSMDQLKALTKKV